jgi:hypothetical protein
VLIDVSGNRWTFLNPKEKSGFVMEEPATYRRDDHLVYRVLDALKIPQPTGLKPSKEFLHRPREIAKRIFPLWPDDFGPARSQAELDEFLAITRGIADVLKLEASAASSKDAPAAASIFSLLYQDPLDTAMPMVDWTIALNMPSKPITLSWSRKATSDYRIVFYDATFDRSARQFAGFSDWKIARYTAAELSRGVIKPPFAASRSPLEWLRKNEASRVSPVHPRETNAEL